MNLFPVSKPRDHDSRDEQQVDDREQRQTDSENQTLLRCHRTRSHLCRLRFPLPPCVRGQPQTERSQDQREVFFRGECQQKARGCRLEPSSFETVDSEKHRRHAEGHRPKRLQVNFKVEKLQRRIKQPGDCQKTSACRRAGMSTGHPENRDRSSGEHECLAKFQQ